MECPKCDWEGTPNLEETGPHTKATCPKCKSYIKFITKEELNDIIYKPVISKSVIRRLAVQKPRTFTKEQICQKKPTQTKPF